MTTNSTVCTPTTPDTAHEPVPHTDPVALGYEQWAATVAPLVPWFSTATPAEQRSLWADHCLYHGEAPLPVYTGMVAEYDGFPEYVAAAAGATDDFTAGQYTDRLSVWLAEDAAARAEAASATAKTTASVVAQEPVPQEPVYECTEQDEAKALDQWTKHARSAAVAALEQGLAGLRYVRCRMALHPDVKRSRCLETLADRWQEHSDSTVTDNMVRLSLLHAAVWELLSPYSPDGKRKPGAVSGRVLRAWAPLVTLDTVSRQERYTLPTGYETLCQEQWAKGTAAKLTGAEFVDVVAVIQATIATAKRLAAEERWTTDPRHATLGDLTSARKAELAAVAATGEKGKPAPVAPALSVAALEACRKAGVEPAEQPATGTGAPAPATDEKPATGGKGTGTPAPAAKAKAAPAAEDDDKPGTVAPNTDTAQGVSPLAALVASARASASAPKAVAEYCVHLVATADAPDDVVEELCRMLAGCKELSTGTRDVLAGTVQRLLQGSKATVAA